MNRNTRGVPVSQNEISEMINLYGMGLKLKEISKILHRKPQTISMHLKENGIKIRNNTHYRTPKELATNKKYTFDENYFKIIDTYEKAYWLGFIYADGCVYFKKGAETTKGGTFEMTLKEEDFYHLCNFRECISGDMPVKLKKVKLNGKIFNGYRIIVNSVAFVENLIDKGCIPNKSLILKFPKKDKLPEKFYGSFIRGYFDGDGHVGFYKHKRNKCFTITMLGTYDFLSEIKRILEKDAEINRVTLRLPKGENAWVLSISKTDSLNKFFNFTYDERSYVLGRKYDKFIEALSYYKKDYKRSRTANSARLLDD